MSGGERDGGSVLLLLLAYVVLALVTATVVAGASAVHLERKQLHALADSAALDAADAVDEQALYAGGLGEAVPLTDAAVRESAQAYLDRAAAGEVVAGAAVGAATGTPDGVTAEVELVGVAPVPLVTWLVPQWADGVPLRVVARARASVPG